MTNAEQPNSRLEDRNDRDPWTATAGQGDGPFSNNPIGKSSLGGHALKFTAVLAVIALAAWVVSKKLKHVTWEQVQQGFDSLPREHILIALGLTVLNYLVLTGYDWIAIRFMKKDLSTPRLMSGAIEIGRAHV